MSIIELFKYLAWKKEPSHIKSINKGVKQAKTIQQGWQTMASLKRIETLLVTPTHPIQAYRL